MGASLLISKGANIKSAQRQLRHSTVKQTLDTYAHFVPRGSRRSGAGNGRPRMGAI